MENNKLIAEFMGFDGQHENWCGNNIVEFNHLIGENELRPYNPNERWDDLMPVVIKILKDPSCHIRTECSGVPDSIYPYIRATKPLKGSLIKAEISGIYDGVINFIHWYNDNK